MALTFKKGYQKATCATALKLNVGAIPRHTRAAEGEVTSRVTWRSCQHTTGTQARGGGGEGGAEIFCNMGSMRPWTARAVLHTRTTNASMRATSVSRRPTSARVGARGGMGEGVGQGAGAMARDAVYTGGEEKKRLVIRPLSASSVRGAGGVTSAAAPGQGRVRPSSAGVARRSHAELLMPYSNRDGVQPERK
jgi:hypothetical protein